jgi:hypothetical protein
MLECSTDATLRYIACFGLPRSMVVGPGSGDRLPICREPPGREAWRQLLATADRQRLVGLLHAAVEAEALPVTAHQRQEVVELHTKWCAAVLSLERALLEAESLLTSAGIEVVVLKGTAHAHLMYAEPAWRLFGDNDLLLRSEQFEPAVDLLVRAGYERRVPQARPGFDATFGKGTTLRRPGRDELDLHRTLLFGTFGLRIDLDELFDSSVPFDLGGRRLLALGPETRLLHLCLHASLGDSRPKLASVRDLAQALADPTVDVQLVLRLAGMWECEAVVVRAVELCWQLGIQVGGPLAALAATHSSSRREERAIASYVGDDRRFSRKVLASLSYLDGPGAKLALLRAAVNPTAEFRRSVGSAGRAAWLRRGLRAASRRHDHRPGRR